MHPNIVTFSSSRSFPSRGSREEKEPIDPIPSSADLNMNNTLCVRERERERA